jgi:hypothetical protein
MDKTEKIARLEAWLKENVTGKMYSGVETVRRMEAVQHELERLVDKQIVEELGVYNE